MSRRGRRRAEEDGDIYQPQRYRGCTWHSHLGPNDGKLVGGHGGGEREGAAHAGTVQILDALNVEENNVFDLLPGKGEKGYLEKSGEAMAREIRQPMRVGATYAHPNHVLMGMVPLIRTYNSRRRFPCVQSSRHAFYHPRRLPLLFVVSPF